MVEIGQPALNIKSQGMLLGKDCFLGRTQYWDLRRFLTHATGTKIYLREYKLHRGLLNLNILSSSGARVAQIFVSKNISCLYVAVRQEASDGGTGRARKVLYGWEKKEDWGILAKARIRYAVAIKERSHARFKVLKDPIPLKGLSYLQESRRWNAQAAKAVREGLQRKVLVRKWKVQTKEARSVRQDYVCMDLNGISYEIDGFNGMEYVHSKMLEEKGKIVIRFYQDEKYSNLIKEVVISEQHHGRFIQQETAQVMLADPAFFVQHVRARARSMRSFLEEPQREGAFLDISEKYVGTMGSIQFKIGSEYDENEGSIFASGYKGYKNVVGRIITRNGEKRAYFWPDKIARDKGAPSIIQEGHLWAIKVKGDGWKIRWFASTEECRKNRQQTQKFGKFVFATVGDRVWEENIHLYAREELPQSIRLRVQRRVRGIQIYLDLDPQRIANEQAFLAARELAGRLKVMGIWSSEQEYANGVAPLVARFLALKKTNGNNGNGWAPFYFPLDAVKAFKAILKEGCLSREELGGILNVPYLWKYHEDAMMTVHDRLNLLCPWDPEKKRA